VRRLARENMRLPENERLIRVRKEGHAYAIWLPDLINYAEKRAPDSAENSDEAPIEEIWVNTNEGAQITGYNRSYMSNLAVEMWERPESEREIRTRKRSTGIELWLPDLMAYRRKLRHGPLRKRSLSSLTNA